MKAIIGAVPALVLLLGGCAHFQPEFKAASSRQTEQLAELDKHLTQTDIAKACAEAEKAARAIDKQIDETRASSQKQIQELFQQEMTLAQQIKAAGKQEAGLKSEAIAMQALVTRTTHLETGLSAARADLEVERKKCNESIALLREVVHSLAASQRDLDKFVQSDAKSPLETFVGSLSIAKTLQGQLQRRIDPLQPRFDDISGKVLAVQQALK